jgi:hypothetical protein
LGVGAFLSSESVSGQVLRRARASVCRHEGSHAFSYVLCIRACIQACVFARLRRGLHAYARDNRVRSCRHACEQSLHAFLSSCMSLTLLNSFPLSQAGIKAVGVVAPGHSRESDTALLTGAPPLHPISPVSSSLVRCTLHFVYLPLFLKHPLPLAPSVAHCHYPLAMSEYGSHRERGRIFSLKMSRTEERGGIF